MDTQTKMKILFPLVIIIGILISFASELGGSCYEDVEAYDCEKGNFSLHFHTIYEAFLLLSDKNKKKSCLVDSKYEWLMRIYFCFNRSQNYHEN